MGWRSVLPKGVMRYSIATGRELSSLRSMMPLRSRRRMSRLGTSAIPGDRPPQLAEPARPLAEFVEYAQ